MLDIKNAKVAEVIRIAHGKVVEKSKRFTRLDKDIIVENLVLQLVAKNYKLSPGACKDILASDYGFECRVDEIIRIFRDYQMNQVDKREILISKVAGMVLQLEKGIAGDMKALDTFKVGFTELINAPEVRHAKLYSKLVLNMVYCMIPEFDIDGDTASIRNFGAALCKYVVWDIEDAIRKVYKNKPDTRKENKVKINLDEYNRAISKLEEMERAWKQTDMLLADLQKEFDERLEAVKIQEMTEFFSKLNSERYGCILDELLVVRKGIDTLRKNNYEIPLEISGLLIMIKKLVQFVRDNNINPMVKPGSVLVVKASDVEFWNYEGTPFNNSNEEKKVCVISPGWVYSNKELQISRPKVKEVE